MTDEEGIGIQNSGKDSRQQKSNKDQAASNKAAAGRQ